MPVNSPGLDHDFLIDLLCRFQERGGDPSRFVIIGGNAAAAWVAALLPDRLPPIITKDVDFQVDESVDRDIDMFAEAVGGDVLRPEKSHFTPEKAIVAVNTPDGGDPLEIDFLTTVFGLPEDETLEHAQRLELPTTDGGFLSVCIIHPVHALQALIENYRGLGRRGHTFRERFDVIAQVTKEFLRQMALQVSHLPTSQQKPGYDEVRWGIRKLLMAADSPQYDAVRAETGADLLDAVPSPDEAPIPGLFWQQEVPRLLENVEKRRRRTNNRLKNKGTDPS